MRTVKTIRAMSVLCALSLPGFAMADGTYGDNAGSGDYVYQTRPSLYLGGFYMRPDSKRSTTNRAEGWIIGAGIPVWRGLSLEGNLFTANLDTGTLNQSTLGNSDFYQRGGGLDAVWNFARQDRFNPFVLGGVGAVYDDVLPKSDKKTSLYYDAGLGFTNPIFGNPTTRIRGEARYLHDQFDGGRNDWRVGLALEISLGGAPQERVIIKEVKVPVQVVQPVVMPAPEPAPVAIAPIAVLADYDGDGIPDDRDQCPNTLRGVRVAPSGCALNSQTLTLKNIEFDFNSSSLRSTSNASLDEAVRFLSGEPGVNLQIAGHTDNVGSEAANLKLSSERAEAVRSYLVAHGADATRLSARGFGESRPVESNDSEAGRQANRRVEMIILSGSGR